MPGVVPILVRKDSPVRVPPGDVRWLVESRVGGVSRVATIGRDVEVSLAKGRVHSTQRDQVSGEVQEIDLPLFEIPVIPTDLVVLAIRVVVAALRPADFISSGEHRHAGRQNAREQHVAYLLMAYLIDGRIVGFTLVAVVGRNVVVGAVAVVLAVVLVVLVLVGHEIAQGEAIVGGDEVDRGERATAVGCI